MSKTNVRVESDGTLANTVTAGSHTLQADEPTELGGTDTGPDPYGYLLAALGACTSMTLHMYAGKKGWKLERVGVELSHAKIHAKDCDGCESTEGQIDRIDRVITLEGDLDASQRERLLEIAERCPVHRTLTSETQITSRLA